MATISPRAAVCDPTEGTCLTRLQSVGLAMVAEAGFISLLSLLVLFGLVVRNVIRYYRYAPGKWSLIQSPADAYVLSLFVADLLQSVGAFLDVRWVHRGSVESGAFCNAQGAIQQLGETAVAMTTTVIALHTFIVVWVRKGAYNIGVACGVIAVIWTTVILLVVIPASTKPGYYSPTPLWCWVAEEYMSFRLGGEYVWLWIALFVSISVYTLLFLWSRGYIAVDNERWWVVSPDWRAQSVKDVDASIRTRPSAPSLALLAYPFAYSIVILPVSVARWAAFQGSRVPDEVTFFTVFLHDMFGFVNVALLLTTKPNLLLFWDPRKAGRGRVVGKAQGGQGRAPGDSASRSDGRYGFDVEKLDGPGGGGGGGDRPMLRTPTSTIGGRASVYGDEAEDDHLGANTAERV